MNSAYPQGLYLSKIITARYDEILFFIRDELKKIWKDWMLPEWAIVVWNGAKMRWFIELAKELLKLPVTIWIPACNDVITDTSINDPSFAWVLWSMILANKYRDARSIISFNFSSIFTSVSKVFKKLLP